MKILIAEDDTVSRVVLERTLQSWGHEVLVTCDGAAAWESLQKNNAPEIAILDWMMPHLDGAEVCRRVRDLARTQPTYLILLTAKQQKEDVVVGLDSGANDYVTKPFDRRELRARLRVAERVTSLQRDLAQRVRELSEALSQVRQLRTMLPVCSYCRNVRDDKNYWQSVESYLMEHSDMLFSHGICPDCYTKITLPELAACGIVIDDPEIS
jgi:sigma-B regulation protein RsbU (phosphoserine phosphatase)